MEEQTEVTIPPVGALEPNEELLRRIDELADENLKLLTAIRSLNTNADEVRAFLGGLQFTLQLIMSALVLEVNGPHLLTATPAERNNYLRFLLAQQLDAIPHLMEHINGKQE